MPITPNPPADFTPVQGNYKELKPFRYWCQKVLPLVYDDSLSYYELLCKVVDYLNKTMEDVDTLHDDVDNLHTAYVELQAYVNNYFATLDVQQEINNKLDAMVLDGTLSALVAPYVPPAVVEKIEAMVTSGEFGTIVNTYVPTAVSNKVNDMVTDGTFADITNPQTISASDAWLLEHITNPSSPPLDSSLTLENAAAQSKYVGDHVLRTKPAISTGDLNDYKENGWYVIAGGATSSDISNLPETTTGQRLLFCYTGNSSPISNWVHQFYYNFVSNKIFERFWDGSTWKTWKQVTTTIDDTLTIANAAADAKYVGDHTLHTRPSINTGDLNDYRDNGWHVIAGAATSSDISHLPETTTGQRLLFCYTTGATPITSWCHQVFINFVTGNMYDRFYNGSTWSAWKLLSNYRLINSMSTGDLNNLTKNGWYIIGGAATSSDVSNMPETTIGQRIVLMYGITDDPVNTTFRHQFFFNRATGNLYNRTCTIDGWATWKKITVTVDNTLTIAGDAADAKYVGDHALHTRPSISTGDLNDYKDNGWYVIAGGATSSDISNLPETTTGQRLLFCYTGHTGTITNWVHQFYYNFVSNKVFERFWDGSTWKTWKLVNPYGTLIPFKSNSINYSSDVTAFENVGTKIRVLTYNVAKYNNDSQTYLPNQKIVEFKRLLLMAKADIIGIQEERQYIDSDNTKDSMEYLYKPLYNYRYLQNYVNSIISKYPCTATGELVYTVLGRRLVYCTYTINNKILLIVCTHCSVVEAESMAQYEELIKWVNGVVQMEETSVPTHDYCIILGDFNSNTSTGCDALEALCETYNMQMLNGGYLGWYKTNGDRSADNILLSNNIGIDNIYPYYEMEENLYSDHVPILAELNLL